MPADLAVIGLGHHGLPWPGPPPPPASTPSATTPTPPRRRTRRRALPVDGSLTTPRSAGCSRGLPADHRPRRARPGPHRRPLRHGPLGPDRTLDLTAVTDAARALAARLRPHTTVVLETPSRRAPPRACSARSWRRAPACAPGATSTSRTPRAPRPRQPHPRLHRHPKVIGGLTPACTESAAAFYGRLTDKVVRARGPREAETVKLLETNFRHVNIALVNEMAVLCHELGVDLWDVIRCAETKPFGFQAFRPGPGVGGHGVPVDTVGAHRPLRLVELAGQVNERMPQYVVQRAATLLNEHGKSARGARVLLLGITYKPDLPDRQGSPADEIARRLMDLGAAVSYHDPHVPDWRVRDLPSPAPTPSTRPPPTPT
ncbi:nucleotide sugar dehydrogenase [Streptomyces diastatochromogenes]|nr:nucleotide sugar dehydrogenase [Streptomyces diastatochromogenes]